MFFRLRRVKKLGSSPLARGLHRESRLTWACGGIIPARAGFTRFLLPVRSHCPDHPRSRGVYRPRGRHGRPQAGSSPLARGLPLLLAALARGLLDHPRSRGVYPPVPAPGHRPQGSSPLARGLHHPPVTTIAHRRIIPARAGFTPRHRGTGCSAWDHPRSRGVYYVKNLRRRRYRWIIPARAGFTLCTHLVELHAEDHPRSRGVYYHQQTGDGARLGSSPLARGLRLYMGVMNAQRGIIPARAGFTSTGGRKCPKCSDHPRSRGVYCARAPLDVPP